MIIINHEIRIPLLNNQDLMKSKRVFSWFIWKTVDGSEILRSSFVVEIPLFTTGFSTIPGGFLAGFRKHQRGCCKIPFLPQKSSFSEKWVAYSNNSIYLSNTLPCSTKSMIMGERVARWWFQIFFIFTRPYLWKWSNLTSIFQGVETTNKVDVLFVQTNSGALFYVWSFFLAAVSHEF